MNVSKQIVKANIVIDCRLVIQGHEYLMNGPSYISDNICHDISAVICPALIYPALSVPCHNIPGHAVPGHNISFHI